MELEFLKALVLIFAVSALSILLLHKIKVPPLVGFIAAGVLIGPGGLGIIQDIQKIEVLAEIGIILLLFTVGIEFSRGRLLKIRKAVACGGGGQVGLTMLTVAAVAYFFIQDAGSALFFGALIALSSTAIVLKLLLDRGEMDSPAGRLMTGILIFQDLCVVPFTLLTPFLAGSGADVSELSLAFLKSLLILVVVLFAARWVVPGLFHQVVRTRSRELFTITVIFICMGTAFLTSRFGLSLALGAFLAGIIISESEYAYEATASVIPFKDSFMGLFFVSVGMLVDTGYIVSHWPAVAAAVTAIFFLKTLSTAAALFLMATPLRVSLQAAFGLAQIGEFSFVLAAAGREAGLLSGDVFQLFLSASAITMAATPLAMGAAPAVSAWLTARKPSDGLNEISEETSSLSEHVIIVGFGLNGRNLARTLRETGIPYVVLELNSDTVRKEKTKGQPIFFGDGTSGEILHKLGIKRAKTLVVAISEPVSTRKIAAIARKENPSMHIIIRTRYLSEVEELKSLGADEVIPEEFETSVEIFSRVLSHYNVPRNIINDRIENIREDGYRVFRTHEVPRKTFRAGPLLRGMEAETYFIKKGSGAAGHTLGEINLRAQTGATAMAVQRGSEIYRNPGSDFGICENDIVLLVGKKEDINRSVAYMESYAPEPEKPHL